MAEIKMKLAELTDSEINPRTHPGPQMRALMASIRRFGFAGAVLVDDKNRILAGHARAEAARRLGMTEVPVRRISGLTDTEKRDYVVRDNRLGEMGAWDTDRLADDLESLQAADFDMSDFGFSTVPVPTEVAAAIEDTERQTLDEEDDEGDDPELAPPVMPGAGASAPPPAAEGAPIIDPDSDNRRRGGAAPPGEEYSAEGGDPEGGAQDASEPPVMCPECGHSWAP